MRRTALPKVLPPKLGRIVRRARVAESLLAAATRASAWVHAPGGSGKTTAVAALAEDLKLPVAWLHLDAGDGAAESFFHFLRLATVRALPRTERALPAFAPELAGEATIFARRFARAAIERAPADGATLVLDNLQDVAPESAVHLFIAALAEELAGAWRVFLVSRDAPGRAYMRLRGQGRLEIVPPHEFAFSESELKGALRERGILSEARLEALWKQSRGWIAGALLLAMQPEAALGADAKPMPADSREIFDYFATQAFARVSDEDRRLLLRTAFLTTIAPEGAERLSGIADAGRRLERLAEGGVFTVRLGARPARYRYHDLFRDYLRAEARDSLESGELARLKSASAAELLQLGEPLPGLELLAECADWAAFRQAVLAHAERLLGQGHFQSLSALLQRVPGEARDSDPWILYWLGQCLLGIDGDAAIARLSRAFALFESAGDRAGQLVAAADIPATLLSGLKSSTEYVQWVRRVESLLDALGALPSAFMRVKVLGSLIGGVMDSGITRGRLDDLIAQLLELVPRIEDPNLRLESLTRVASVAWRFGRGDLGPPVIAMVEEQQLESRASPLLVLHWLYDIITFDCMYGDRERALANAGRAEAIAEATGLPHARFEALLLRMEVICDRNDVAEARALHERLKRHADPAREFARAAVHGFRARIALLEDDGALALRECTEAHAALDRAGWPMSLRTAYFMMEAGGNALLGRYGQGLECCARFRPHLAERNQQIVDLFAAWTRAAQAVDAGAPQARTLLAEAVAAARAANFEHALRHANALVSRLCARALEWEIEPAFIRAMIARRGLRPPDAADAAWPRPVRIRCLGRFELQLGDAPEAEPARAQKTLELLQAVIAAGGETSVASLVKALWPGEGRVGAQQAFDTTLHRLRRMLRSDDAVVVTARQVRLDPDLAWVDSVALEHRLDRVEHADGGPGPEDLRTLVGLYSGHFLPQRQDAAWAREAHERLWGRLRRLLIAAARTIRASEAGEAERILYFIADRDPLAEDAFAELMRLHLDRGAPADALRAYERCAAALATELGVQPGAELRRLRARARPSGTKRARK